MNILFNWVCVFGYALFSFYLEAIDLTKALRFKPLTCTESEWAGCPSGQKGQRFHVKT